MKNSETIKLQQKLQELGIRFDANSTFDYLYNRYYNFISLYAYQRDMSDDSLSKIKQLAEKFGCEVSFVEFRIIGTPYNTPMVKINRKKGLEELIEQDGMNYGVRYSHYRNGLSKKVHIFSNENWTSFYRSC